MVIFLLQARRRMIDQWDSCDLMLSETYNSKNQQAKSSFVTVVHSSLTVLVLGGCSGFNNNHSVTWKGPTALHIWDNW